VDPRAVLDAVVKRKIPSPRWESNPRTPIVQTVAQRYTDCENITSSFENNKNSFNKSKYNADTYTEAEFSTLHMCVTNKATEFSVKESRDIRLLKKFPVAMEPDGSTQS
jgi:hypothetical protein